MKVSVLELFVKLTTGSWRLKHLCMYSMHFTMHLLHISCPIQILLFLITYLNSLHSHYFYNASMKCLWWIIDNDYVWLGSLQTNVLGSSSIWTCHILNICFDIFNCVCVKKTNNKYSKFVMSNRWTSKDINWEF